jgi:ABC-2 type transport system ATP-binding protein
MLILQVLNLTKSYDGKIFVLNDISFSICKGDFFSILGKNGAGKSTLIGILISLIKKTSGKVYIYGNDLDNKNIHIKSLIGVMPQDFNFNQFESVFDVIINQAGFYGLSKKYIFERAKFLLQVFDLWNKRFSICVNLSGGMKRRLMFVRSIIHDPEILILDEPTAGVDVFSRKIILDFLKKFNNLGKTVILTTHYFEEVESLCNKMIIIDKGNLLKETMVSDLFFYNSSNVFVLKIDDSSKLSKYNCFIILDKHTIEFNISSSYSFNFFLNILMSANVIVYNINAKNNALEDFFIKSLQ